MQIQIARAAARDAAGAVLLAVMRGRCAEGTDFKEPPTLESPLCVEHQSACGATVACYACGMLHGDPTKLRKLQDFGTCLKLAV